MARTILANTGVWSFANNSQTRVLPLIGGRDVVIATTANESQVQFVVRQAGIIRNLSAVVSTNTRITDTTVNLRVNAALSSPALACTFGAGVTGRVTQPGVDVAVSPGDLISIGLTQGTGGGSMEVVAVQADFEADSGDTVIYYRQQGSRANSFPATSTGPNYTSPTTNQRDSLFGWETNANRGWWNTRFPIGAAATFSHARIVVTSKTIDINPVVTLHKNGSPTAITMTITGVGTFEDTSNTVHCDPGDYLEWEFDWTGRTSGEVGYTSLELMATCDGEAFDLHANRPSGGSVPGAGGEFFYGHAGHLNAEASEVRRQIYFSFAATLSDLRVSAQVAAGTGADARLRINGVDQTMFATVPNAPSPTRTDLYVDAVNEDAVTAGDLVSIAAQFSSVAGLLSAGYTVNPGDPTTATAPAPGALRIAGPAPGVITGATPAPASGALRISGPAPIINTGGVVEPDGGALRISGPAPTVTTGFTASPAPARLQLGGPKPVVNERRASQLLLQVLGNEQPPAEASQLAEQVLAEVTPGAEASQLVDLLLGEVVPPVKVMQSVQLILAEAVPCLTRQAQVWILQRLDGVSLAFTSHDEPIEFLGYTARPCRSLNASASEAASELGAIGNIELTGIIAAGGITEIDLYAGRYDGCQVDVWLVSWDPGTALSPKRLAAGRVGAVSHGRDGFKGEVLGLGAQMGQQGVTQVITPACRFRFGDARCGKDLAPLTVTGAATAIARKPDQRTFSDSALLATSPAPDEDHFRFGVVTWTSGENEGLQSEVKEYDAATATFVLWSLMPHRIAIGDTYIATPGCTLAAEGAHGCKYWNNYVNFGGFPDVPGEDAISETPDAKY